jgi:hypothetical protein
MPILPADIVHLLRPFAQAFSERTWEWVQVLIVGAILAPGRRTVTAILRVLGLSYERQFQRYHRVLNRVKWSGLLLSRILVTLLVATFLVVGVPLLIAADETIERRSGKKSVPRAFSAIRCAPVRSAGSYACSVKRLVLRNCFCIRKWRS